MAIELTGRQQFGDRNVETHSAGLRGTDQDPHVASGPVPAGPGGIDVPTAVHSHMRAQNQVPGKSHEEVLAACGNGLDGPSNDRTVVGNAVQRREDGLEPRDQMAGHEGVERPGGPEDRVPFRHLQKVWNIQNRVFVLANIGGKFSSRRQT